MRTPTWNHPNCDPCAARGVLSDWTRLTDRLALRRLATIGSAVDTTNSFQRRGRRRLRHEALVCPVCCDIPAAGRPTQCAGCEQILRPTQRADCEQILSHKKLPAGVRGLSRFKLRIVGLRAGFRFTNNRSTCPGLNADGAPCRANASPNGSCRWHQGKALTINDLKRESSKGRIGEHCRLPDGGSIPSSRIDSGGSARAQSPEAPPIILSTGAKA